MKKPIIALTGQLEMKTGLPIEIGIYGATNHNCDQLVKHGAIPVVVPFIKPEDARQIIANVDGLLMTGGADINPALYKEETLPFCAAIQPDRDVNDLALFAEALKQGKPILCICRGCQIGNVYLGGSLYQDLTQQTGTEIEHTHFPSWKDETGHTLTITEGSPFHTLLGKTELGVNTLHHQGIKDLGNGVIPMARATDGLIEAWYYDSDTQWVRAYQWHPEMQNDNGSNEKIFEDFINACKK